MIGASHVPEVAVVDDSMPDSGLKPRPHHQQCRSNIVECYRSNDSFDKVKCCFNKVERCFNIIAGVDGALDEVETN